MSLLAPRSAARQRNVPRKALGRDGELDHVRPLVLGKQRLPHRYAVDEHQHFVRPRPANRRRTRSGGLLVSMGTRSLKRVPTSAQLSPLTSPMRVGAGASTNAALCTSPRSTTGPSTSSAPLRSGSRRSTAPGSSSGSDALVLALRSIAGGFAAGSPTDESERSRPQPIAAQHATIDHTRRKRTLTARWVAPLAPRGAPRCRSP